MMAKPMKTLELHYPMIQFLIIGDRKRIIATGLGTQAFLINQYLLTSAPLKPGAPDLPEGPCEDQVILRLVLYDIFFPVFVLWP